MRLALLATTALLGSCAALAPRVLRSFEGTGDDHLGVALAGPGDLDGDGRADLLLGSVQGAFTTYGPGYVRAVSGASGATLHVARGRDDEDGFGETIVALGDVDADGFPDYGVPAVRSWSAYVRIVSGRTGGTLREVPAEFWDGDVAPAGDLDGDGHADVLVGSDGTTRALCGASGAELWSAAAVPLGPAGDVDRDGAGDVLLVPVETWTLGPRAPYALVCSGRDGRVLAELAMTDAGARPEASACADLDGDGVAEVLGVRGARAFVASARTGAVRTWVDGFRGIADVRAAGDVDGDGAADLLLELGRALGDIPLLTFGLGIASGRDGRPLVELRQRPFFGHGVASALGDVDGDGRAEVAATDADGGHAGRVHVVGFGR